MAELPGCSPEHALMLRKLQSIAPLAPDDRDALCTLPLRFQDVADGADVVREGERPPECCLVVEGFFCRYRIVGTGQRQIMAFHGPGDIPDLQSLQIRTMDHSIGALTAGRVAFVPHDNMREVLRHHRGVLNAFWRDTLIDAAIFREWLASNGRRTAHQRVAHLLCEVYLRLQAVGLAEAGAFELPLTQAELADALGLSTVHVNRVLQDFRRDGLIASPPRRVHILDWERLQDVGDFEPTYLHQLDPQDRRVA